MVNQYLKVIASDRNFTRAHFDRIEWRRFSSYIINTGIASLFYPKIQGIKDHLPAHITQLFRTHYENALLFKDFSLSILHKLQPGLSDTGTIVITQGIALSEDIYHEPLCRSMGDIDLYLPEGNSDAVKRILRENGFRQYRHYENVFAFKQIMIDLHEGLWGTDRIIQREYIVPENKVSLQPSTLIEGFYILCPEHLALHCAFHGLKHSFNKDIWSLDLLMLYNKGHLTKHAGNRQEYILKTMAFEHLSQKGLIPPSSPDSKKYRLSPFQKKSILLCMHINNRIEVGQLALALMCPSIIKSIHYLLALCIPPKFILCQMYGPLPYPMLLLIRLFNLVKHTARALIWHR